MRLCKPPLQLWVSVPLALLGFWLLSGTIAPLPNSHPVAIRTLKPPGKASPAHSAQQPRLVNSFGKLPLSFEANLGQTDARVKFLSRGRGYSLFLTGDEAVLSLRSQEPGVRSQPTTARNWKFENRNWPEAMRPLSVVPGPLLKTPSAPGIGSIANGQQTIDNSLAPSPDARHSSLVTRHSEVLRLKLAGANPKAKVVGLEKLPGKSNYFIGNDPKKWRTNVPNYARVMLKDVYPGIDQVFYGRDGELEYDFVVKPGADPQAIRFAVETGNSKFEKRNWKFENRKSKIDEHGDLVIATDAGEIRLRKPTVYQPVAASNARRRANGDGTSPPQPNPKSRLGESPAETKIENQKSVDGYYVLLADNHIGFELSNYDAAQTLVIDPTLVYSTYLGGASSDAAHGIGVDGAGNAYVTGHTGSVNFPTQNPFQPSVAGGGDVFVAKLEATGAALGYSTYLGGTGDDVGYGIVVDSAGNAYVIGQTGSNDFPIENAFQASSGGSSDAFVTKLAPSGAALSYSTYLGGTGGEFGLGIAVDTAGNVYLTGQTSSSDFPIQNPFQASYASGGDAFVAKLEASGAALSYSTYLGGGSYGLGIAVDSTGSAYVTGQTSSYFPVQNAFQPSNGGTWDAFVTKLEPSGATLCYSTFLGGTGVDSGEGIAVDTAGNAYVTGYAGSSDFPLQNPLQASYAGVADAFVAKLVPSGAALSYSTFLGGTSSDYGFGIAVDATGNAHVTGATGSADFPTWNPLQGPNVGPLGAFVAKLEPNGAALSYSSILGVTNDDYGFAIALDAAGNAYVTGYTYSTRFPTQNPFQASNAGASDAFAAKVSPLTPALQLAPSALTFASQLVGSTSASQPATLTNTGDAPLSITGITVSGANAGDFSESNACGTSVSAGANCTTNVTFTPTVTGDRSATLTVTDTAAGSPHTLALTGKGTDFAVATASGGATSATVAAGETATYRLSIAPTGYVGTVALGCTGAPPRATCAPSLGSVMLDGVNPASFTIIVKTTARAMAGPEVGPRLSTPQVGARRAVPLQVWLVVLMLLVGMAAMGRRKGRVIDLPLRGWRGGRVADPPLQWRRPIGPSLLAAVLLLVVVWAACGGGGGGGGGNTGTPPGTYSLTVTATASGVSRSMSLTLTVN